MSESTRFFRDLLALSGGELASKLIAFAAFAYLARVLQPEAYGSLELAVSLALSFAMLIDFGLSPIGAREVARNPSESARLAARIPTARLVVALLAIPAMGLLVLAMRKPAETVQLVWLFALSLVALPFTQRWLFQGLEKMLWVSAGGVIRMGVFALGVVIWVREPADLVHIGVVEVCSLSAVACFAGMRSALAERSFGAASPRSSSSSPKRRSGLSVPYREIASAYEMRGIGSFSSLPSTSRQRWASSASTTVQKSSTST